jgi:hypothetical protein
VLELAPPTATATRSVLTEGLRWTLTHVWRTAAQERAAARAAAAEQERMRRRATMRLSKGGDQSILQTLRQTGTHADVRHAVAAAVRALGLLDPYMHLCMPTARRFGSQWRFAFRTLLFTPHSPRHATLSPYLSYYPTIPPSSYPTISLSHYPTIPLSHYLTIQPSHPSSPCGQALPWKALSARKSRWCGGRADVLCGGRVRVCCARARCVGAQRGGVGAHWNIRRWRRSSSSFRRRHSAR